MKIGDVVEYHLTSDMNRDTLVGYAIILEKVHDFSWMIASTRGQKLMWNPDSMRLLNEKR